ncbi:hypothetical protein BCV70DRAFT_166703 [Testicularia cyperi]|uniref:Endonuclease/exonuclease/phosphatase domain-containing protein n=1 Tax=Testicularia cyperi TaxID=1882483 RepID=A0A317XJ57_9BASI|nr:hypothetical protein BCV70DRAFT_166703 [Testicularia cyperi]
MPALPTTTTRTRPRPRSRCLPMLLLASVVVIFCLYYFQTYDFVSLGVNKMVPFSQSTSQQSQIAPSSPSSESANTIKLSRRKAKLSLNVGSINIRYSRDARYDSSHSTLKNIKQIWSGGHGQLSAIAPGGSPYIMQQYWGERSWLLRGPKIADVPLFHDWDLFAFQEVLDAQYSNLVGWLGDEYDHAGVGRDDGKRAGEAVPIFWRRDVFSLVSEKDGGVGENGVQHFWLSPTPEVPGSVGWDAALTRMCTHVSLKLHATGEIVHVFSTHYDHKGVLARAKSSELIVERARAASAHTKKVLAERKARRQSETEEPLIVLIGDLNSPRNEGSWSTLVAGNYALPPNSTGSTFLDTAMSVPTKKKSPFLTDNEDPHRSELASGRILPPVRDDTVEHVSGMLYEPLGALRTFTDFEPSPRNAIDDRIDFIMVLANKAVQDQTRKDTLLDHSRSPPPPLSPLSGRVPRFEAERPDSDSATSTWKIKTFGTLQNWSEGDAGFLLSDHRPVMSRLERTF